MALRNFSKDVIAISESEIKIMRDEFRGRRFHAVFTEPIPEVILKPTPFWINDWRNKRGRKHAKQKR